jgi:hypothetical protein
MSVRFLPGLSVQQKRALPLLQHKTESWVACRIDEVLSDDELLEKLGPQAWPTSPLPLHLDLSAISIHLSKAEVKVEEGCMRFVLTRG